MRLAEGIRNRMESRSLIAADICRMTGILPSRLSKWLNGEGQPSVEQAARIAEALGTTVDALIGGDESRAQALTIDQIRILAVVDALELSADEVIRRLKSQPAESEGGVTTRTQRTDRPARSGNRVG